MLCSDFVGDPMTVRRTTVRALGAALLLLTAACSSGVDGVPVAAGSSGEQASPRPGTAGALVPGAPGTSDDLAEDRVDPFAPSADNPDPSTVIPGVHAGVPMPVDGPLQYLMYRDASHVPDGSRVAYDRFPPVGGPHSALWAACNGVVYPTGVQNENMVHSLEHGAVWVSYNPDTISPADLSTMTDLVQGEPYLVMSAYPGQESPISLQSWAHQLAVESADDERILQFITALRANPYVTPEPGATCEQPQFDVQNPPPLNTTAPGPDAVPMIASVEPSAAPTTG